MADPEKFNAALQTFNPSGNIEDRRSGYAPSVGAENLRNLAEGSRALVSDIGTALFGDRAAPGSLPAQIGVNNIGTTTGGILGGLLPAAPAAPAAPPAAPAAPPAAPAAPAASSPSSSVESTSEKYRKGTANVKGKGSKNGKASKPGGSPKGLEALLPLLAAMQGGGAAGPPAGAPSMPGGAGLKKGSANVKGKGGKSKSSDQPAGLEALLSALAAGGAGGAGGASGAPPAAGVPMTPGAAPPGFAYGMSDVQMTPPAVPQLMPMVLPSAPSSRYARGTPSVEENPDYPFGAGYLFGQTAVPGEGSGTTDTVPAMLAPHEAVLNRAAADMLGRGLIAALNAQGVQKMGMRRGTAT